MASPPIGRWPAGYYLLLEHLCSALRHPDRVISTRIKARHQVALVVY